MRLVISLAVGLVSSSAAPRCEVYPTVAASDAWMSRVQHLPLRRQVAALRQRLTCDARVRGRVEAASVCVSCLTAEGRRAYQQAQAQRSQAEAGDTRPPGIVLFYLIDGRPVAPADTGRWQPLFQRRAVRKISFVASAQAAVMGGSRAQDGLVLISTSQ